MTWITEARPYDGVAGREDELNRGTHLGGDGVWDVGEGLLGGADLNFVVCCLAVLEP